MRTDSEISSLFVSSRRNKKNAFNGILIVDSIVLRYWRSYFHTADVDIGLKIDQQTLFGLYLKHGRREK